MTSICVNTSFLISLADQSRPHHATATQYFRYAVENGYTLVLSALVIAEFEVKQRITDLPLLNFQLLPFSARHAIKSAEFHRDLATVPKQDEAARHVVRNDLKILAQSELEGCVVILGEDANTLTRW